MDARLSIRCACLLRGAAVIAVSTLVLIGCDSFAISDYYQRTLGLNPGIETGRVEQGGSVHIDPRGGTAPYEIEVQERFLAYECEESGIGDLEERDGAFVFRAGDSIGTVGVTCTDGRGVTVAQSLDIVPARPTDFSVDAEEPRHPQRVTLAWRHDKPGAEGFRVRYRRSGGDWEQRELEENPDDGPEFDAIVDGLSPGEEYKFELTTYLDEFESPPAQATQETEDQNDENDDG